MGEDFVLYFLFFAVAASRYYAVVVKRYRSVGLRIHRLARRRRACVDTLEHLLLEPKCTGRSMPVLGESYTVQDYSSTWPQELHHGV